MGNKVKSRSKSLRSDVNTTIGSSVGYVSVLVSTHLIYVGLHRDGVALQEGIGFGGPVWSRSMDTS